jgi:hypothetical protein
MVEYVAQLFVNPDAPMDYSHSTMRERILYAFHLDGFDPLALRNRLIRGQTRGGFVGEVDAASVDDESWRWWARDVAARRNSVRWTIALAAQDALREAGLLRDRLADPVIGEEEAVAAEKSPVEVVDDH